MDKILIEASIGELIDKITILEIKKQKIKDISNLEMIDKEYMSLKTVLEKHLIMDDKLKELYTKLKDTNLKLWDIEDGKRAAEKNKEFGEKFIKLARNVYKLNDERAKIKLTINTELDSNIKEVKSYE